MNRHLLTSVALMLAMPAPAATIRQYTPGGSPCAGSCSYEWAIAESGAPEGEPQRMMVPAGTYISWMSYAKDGEPYGGPDSAILSQDEPGEGYFYEVNGVTYLFVKLDACDNWAIMQPQGGVLAAPMQPVAPSGPQMASVPRYAPTGIGFSIVTDGGGSSWGDTYITNVVNTVTQSSSTSVVNVINIVDCPECCEPPPPPPVPLPAAGFALLTALVGLGLWRKLA